MDIGPRRKHGIVRPRLFRASLTLPAAVILMICQASPAWSGGSVKSIPPLDRARQVFRLAGHDARSERPSFMHPVRPGQRRTPGTRSAADIYVIDTAIAYGSGSTDWKYSYSYDANGRRLTELDQEVANGIWVDQFLYTGTYDERGDQLTYLFQQWQNGEWTERERWSSTYDDRGNQTLLLDEQWDNGQLQFATRNTMTYDSLNQLTSNLTEFGGTGTWSNYLLATFTYDSHSRELSELDQQWDGAQWVNWDKETFAYDSSGNFLSLLYATWDGGQFTNSSLISNTYDGGGHLLQYLLELWSNGQWANSLRQSYSYSAGGKLLVEEYDEWLNSGWTGTQRMTCTYDANERLSTTLWESYNGGQWWNGTFESYLRNPKGYISTFFAQKWQGDSLVPSQGDLWISDSSGNTSGFTGYKVEIRYTGETWPSLVEPQSFPEDFRLSQNYPNPFNPSTTISFNLPRRARVKLRIFDILGREVATLVDEEKQPGSYSVRWDARPIASGVYFYELRAGSYRGVKKMVLIR